MIASFQDYQAALLLFKEFRSGLRTFERAKRAMNLGHQNLNGFIMSKVREEADRILDDIVEFETRNYPNDPELVKADYLKKAAEEDAVSDEKYEKQRSGNILELIMDALIKTEQKKKEEPEQKEGTEPVL